MTNMALITGASSGIGKELARYHAAKGGDLILTARREAELNALKVELVERQGVAVHVFPADIGAGDGAMELYRSLKSAGLRVDILINNAGFGGYGVHVERDLDAEMAMIDLNVKALVTLTHEFGREMADQGGGKILNVGSTAGFMPGPKQAVYFATKALVNSFSQAIDQELRSKGVTCTVLAPGYVETEFVARADLESAKMLKGGGATAASVAKHGYDAGRTRHRQRAPTRVHAELDHAASAAASDNENDRQDAVEIGVPNRRSQRRLIAVSHSMWPDLSLTRAAAEGPLFWGVSPACART